MNSSGEIRNLAIDELPKSNEILLNKAEAFRLKRSSIKARKNWMRNQLCKCGSGKKTKKCCWTKMARSLEDPWKDVDKARKLIEDLDK